MYLPGGKEVPSAITTFTFLVSLLEHQGVEHDVRDDAHLDEAPKPCVVRACIDVCVDRGARIVGPNFLSSPPLFIFSGPKTFIIHLAALAIASPAPPFLGSSPFSGRTDRLSMKVITMLSRARAQARRRTLSLSVCLPQERLDSGGGGGGSTYL